MYHKQHNKQILLVSLLVGLTGCASPPPEVKASRHLISSVSVNSFTKITSQEVITHLNQTTEGSEFDYQNVNVTLLNNYTSALGHYCQNIKLTPLIAMPENNTLDNHSTKQYRIVCRENNNNWFIIPLVSDNKIQPLGFDSLIR